MFTVEQILGRRQRQLGRPERQLCGSDRQKSGSQRQLESTSEDMIVKIMIPLLLEHTIEGQQAIAISRRMTGEWREATF